MRGGITGCGFHRHFVTHIDRYLGFQRRTLPRQDLGLVGIFDRYFFTIQCRIGCALVAVQGYDRLFLVGRRATASGYAPVGFAFLDVVKLVKHIIFLFRLIDAALLADGEGTWFFAVLRNIGQRVLGRGGFQRRGFRVFAGHGRHKAFHLLYLFIERAE